MTGRIGDVVGIYMDTTMRIREADVIQTPTGRSYRVVTIRTQTRGIHEGRQHMRVLVIDPATIQPDDTIIPIHWYTRSKRRS